MKVFKSIKAKVALLGVYRFDEPIPSLLVCAVSPFQRKGETVNLREVLKVYVRIT